MAERLFRGSTHGVRGGESLSDRDNKVSLSRKPAWGGPPEHLWAPLGEKKHNKLERLKRWFKGSKKK